VIRQITIGPALHAGTPESTPAQQLVVVNYYNPAGLLDSLHRSSSPDTNGIGTIKTQWRYDAAMRRVEEIAPDSAIEQMRYDAAGNVIARTTRRGHVITMTYDALNRLTSREVPTVLYSDTTTGTWQFPRYSNNGAGYGVPWDIEEFGYDAVGNLIKANNAYARIARHYNVDGTLKADTMAIRTYNSTGSISDWAVHVYGLGFEYDLDGRRTTLRHPEVLAPHVAGVLKDSTTYHYESATGFLSSITDPLGNTFQFHYDDQGRLEHLDYPGGIYEERQYDADSRVRRRTEIATNLVGTDIGFDRDTLRDEHLWLDAGGRVTKVESNYPLSDEADNYYNGLGALTRARRSYQLWGVDPTWCPAGCYFPAGSDEQITLDALGNVKRRIDKNYTDPSDPTQWTGDDKTMTYQVGVGRLLSAGSPQDLHRYDSAGNEYFYEHRTNTSIGEVERGARYYAADDRLAATDVRSSFSCYELNCYKTYFDEYWYDALGRRILRRSRTDLACTNQHCRSVIQRTVWDGDQILYEIQYPGGDTVSSELLERDTVTLEPDSRFWGRVAYTHGPTLDRPLDVIRMNYGHDFGDGYGFDGYDAIAIVPHWDWRGMADLGSFSDGARSRCRPNGSGGHYMNRCVMVDWVYAVNASRDLVLPQADTSWFGSLTKQQRDATGLLYMRNRYYDPLTGRFTQEDPLGLAGGLNLYGFAAGDPINYADPFGLCPYCAGPLALAGVGAAEEGVPLIGQIVGTATIAAAGIWLAYSALAQDRADAVPLAQTDREDDGGVTVRLQAQGGGLEQSVVLQSGASGVVTGADALHGLGLLQSSLSAKDAAARARSFVKAAKFIQSAAAGGGTGYVKKSFTAGPGTKVRVDVEVLRGHALTPGGRSDAIVTPP
jgi:RHS repeat-associated protein